MSGYTKSAWVTAARPKPALSTPDNQHDTKVRGSVTLPYVGRVSDAIGRTIRKTGINVHMKPYNTIRQALVHPKDKVPLGDQTGVVYKIQCADCDASYVGETERTLKKRVTEHHRSSSPVGHHTSYNHHQFSHSDVSVLHRDADWFRRGVAEAIHITTQRPSLNRDRGRHTLPAIYREILDPRDLSPATGSRGNATTHSHLPSADEGVRMDPESF